MSDSRIVTIGFITIMLFMFSTGAVIANDVSVNPVVLDNGIVRYEFESGTMGLSAMIDLATGVNHINPVKGKHDLWTLTFANGTQKSYRSSTESDCTSYTLNHTPGGDQTAVFEWRDIDHWREKAAFSVKVEATLPQGASMASFRIWVENRSDIWGLWDVLCPKVNGFLTAGEYDVAIPGGNWGKLYKDCATRLSFNYPTGWNMPMQFMCAFKDGRGVYMAAHDPRSWSKYLTVSPGYEFSIRTYAEDMAVPGSDFDAPFPVMFGVYEGGWMQACKLYRQFALTAPWTSRGKISSRTDLPKALKDVGLWMRIRGLAGLDEGTTEERNRALLDARDYFDVPIAVHWYDWHQVHYDTQYPHFFPEKPGFADQFKDLVSKGMLVMPYINGRIIDTFNEDYDRFYPNLVKDQAGKPHLEVYKMDSGRMAVMCPYTRFWQDEISGLVGKMGRDLGVTGVYIDQISASRPMLCFDESHGHPLGGGSWWVDGYREMLRKVQKAAHSNGNNMIVTSENAAEPFMDGIDAFLIWIRRDDREIPMITSVYSGYSLYFSSPAWFEHGDRSWIMVQGRDFLWGTQNGWMSMELMAPEHKNKAAFLKQVGKYRVAGRKFLTYGELVDLVQADNTLPTVTETWPDQSNNPREATLPAVQGAIWKAEDGTLGVFLVNYREEDTAIEFTVDPARYGLSEANGGYTVTEITPDSRMEAENISGDVISRKETLGPWEIRLLEIAAKRK